MSSGSVRLHAPVDIHQHDEPPETGARPALPDARGEAECCGQDLPAAGRLWREDGKVLYRDPDGGEAQAVRVLWARPLSGRGGPVSIMMAGKKREVAYVASLDELDADSRRVAEEELAVGMVLPRIKRIRQVRPRFGSYYWDVETDMGRNKFVLSSPENNHFRFGNDTVVVKDVAGNCYEIPSVSELDADSRRELDRVL